MDFEFDYNNRSGNFWQFFILFFDDLSNNVDHFPFIWPCLGVKKIGNVAPSEIAVDMHPSLHILPTQKKK